MQLIFQGLPTGIQSSRGNQADMPERDYLVQLDRRILLSRLASLGVLFAGLFFLVLYSEPFLQSVGLETRGPYRGELLWLGVGTVLTAAGLGFLQVLNNWPGQLKKTILHTVSVRMTVQLEVQEDNDSTSYYAVIKQRPVEGENTAAWRAHIWVYPRQIGEDAGRQFEGDVFLHAKTGLPVAIEYSRGMLWVMAGNGAVKRLRDEGSLQNR
jgi:hypothetical protein